MRRIANLSKKTVRTLVKEGPTSVIKKATNKVRERVTGDYTRYAYRDILVINGCMLPHPQRYRVTHQIEQLRAFGVTAHCVDYDQLDLEQIKFYRGFVFYRCPITSVIEEFISRAKYYNKAVFFDVDDLVIDCKYTDEIEYVKNMTADDRKLYDDGVNRMKKTLQLCDFAITTTGRLKEELENYVKEVYINRNVASEKMLALSKKAISEKHNEESKIILGYFSGSITHNDDFAFMLPILEELMSKYKNVFLKVVGILDIPKELEKYRERIIAEPFVEWKKLPELVASVDINLAPLKQSIFNEAKSENKWLEAALVKVPTIASNLGAFSEVVHNKVDGVLCSNMEEWFGALEELITDEVYRIKLAENAYQRVVKNYITTYSGKGLADFIVSKLKRNIGFVVPTTNVSGGINVIVKHANILRASGCDVFLVSEDNIDKPIAIKGEVLPVIVEKYTRFEGFVDTLVATLWSTLKFVEKTPNVFNRCYLVQGFETDFANDGQYTKIVANATYNRRIPIEYLTISKWCEEWLKREFDQKVVYAPNGIDLELFQYKERSFDGKIRILIEGSCKDAKKNVDESFKIVEKLEEDKYEIVYLSYDGEGKEWYRRDKCLNKVPYDKVASVYQNCHILLKSSILESFSYPPLEMMATGGISVVVPNDGNREYLVDEENCMLYNSGDIEDAVKQINRITEDRDLREKLVSNGLKTAKERSWKNIEEKILEMYKLG